MRHRRGAPTVSVQEAPKPAYWGVSSKINDGAEYKKYTDLVPAIAKYGGKVMARGGRYQIMEGPNRFHSFVVIEFPTFKQGVACSTSDKYYNAAAFRRGGENNHGRLRPRDAMMLSDKLAAGLG